MGINGHAGSHEEPAGSSWTCGLSSSTTLVVVVGGGRVCGMSLHVPPLLRTSLCSAFVWSQVVALRYYYSFSGAQAYFYSIETPDLPWK